MSRIFITGPADGLGQLAAKALIDLRHQVVLHHAMKKEHKRLWIKCSVQKLY